MFPSASSLASLPSPLNRPLGSLQLPAAVTRARWSRDNGALVLALHATSRLHAVDPLSMASSEYLPNSSGLPTGAVSDLCVVDAAADGHPSAMQACLVAACRDGFLRVWDPRAGPFPRAVAAHPSRQAFSSLCLSPDSWLLCGHSAQDLLVWDARSLRAPISSHDIRKLLADALDVAPSSFKGHAFDLANVAPLPAPASSGALAFQLRSGALGVLDVAASRVANLISARYHWRSAAHMDAAGGLAGCLSEAEDVSPFDRSFLSFSSQGLPPPHLCLSAHSHSPFLHIIDFHDNPHSRQPQRGRVANVLLPSLVTAVDTHPLLGISFVGLANQGLYIFAETTTTHVA